jgi:hypothetical protein
MFLIQGIGVVHQVNYTIQHQENQITLSYTLKDQSIHRRGTYAKRGFLLSPQFQASISTKQIL